jgi:hypothetical protein
MESKRGTAFRVVREYSPITPRAIRGLRLIRKQTRQSFISCCRFRVFWNPAFFTRSLNGVLSQPLLQIWGLTSLRRG